LQEKEQPRSNSEEEGLVVEEVGGLPVVTKEVALIVAKTQVPGL
jgi:hypothetical protein